MLTSDLTEAWLQFIEFAKKRCSPTAFGNWLAPIRVIPAEEGDLIKLEVPNIFVKEYLLSNYREDLLAFLPVNHQGDPAIEFVLSTPEPVKSAASVTSTVEKKEEPLFKLKLNPNYRFDNFIEGPTNQFVKSAANGVASRPGQSYNPLVIHGGVGLGKTHILHSIGHYVAQNHRKLRVHCITTEEFINDLVDSLRNKSIYKLKQFYRSEVDILLVDDIQLLQNRLNFEEEFCNTFETLINQHKQIVITSDKPPSQLKLSERMIARMEWGLVAHIGVPELETRVAILQYKAEQKGLHIPTKVAFFIAEHINNNVRQLEGAINRLSAHCRMLNLAMSEELVEKALREMLQKAPREKITVEQILKSVATIFEVRVSDIKGSSRTKNIALSRQVAMYLAKEMIQESLTMLGASFGGKAHSTILHAWNTIEEKITTDKVLSRKIEMVQDALGRELAK